METKGVEPSSSGCKPDALPLSYAPINIKEAGCHYPTSTLAGGRPDSNRHLLQLWCRPSESHRGLRLFRPACALRYTRAANIGCPPGSRTPLFWSRTRRRTDRPEGNGTIDGSRTRFLRRDKPVPPLLWLRWYEFWQAVEDSHPHLQTWKLA